MKQIEVVAAILYDAAGRIFATQRGYGEWKGWWEFPGGKIEANETPQMALQREMLEELDAKVQVGPLLKTVTYDYPQFHLILHCYRCTLLNAVTLKEHQAAQWLYPHELFRVQWLPADEEVIMYLSQSI